MGKRGSIIETQLVYWICLILFFIGMIAVVQRVSSQTSDWEGYYAFSLASLVNQLQPGDEVRLDVTPVVLRAQSAKVSNALSDAIRIASGTHEVGVQLSPGSWHWYRWYSPVIVEKAEIIPEGERMILSFKVVQG